MISERSFAASFPGFWAELLPLLTPSFVHIVNEGFKTQLTDKYRVPLKPVPKHPDIQDPSVIAEFAFFLAKTSIEDGIRMEELIKKRKFIESAKHYALNIIAKYKGGTKSNGLTIDEAGIEEGIAIALNYQRFFAQRAEGQSIEFSPEIPGAGFISTCKGDISVGNALFEVKTVDRGVSGKDIRQIIVYLALQAATGVRRWIDAGFLNPRRAVYYEFRIDNFILRMSGRPSAEVFRDLVDFVCIRDVQIDSAF